MGYIRHHAILVTSWDDEKIEAAHRRASEIFRAVSPILSSQINAFRSFFIPPDGSKEGWAESDAGDSLRDAMIDWLNDQAYGDGSTVFDWAEIQYGDDSHENKVLRHEANQRPAPDPGAEENDG